MKEGTVEEIIIDGRVFPCEKRGVKNLDPISWSVDVGDFTPSPEFKNEIARLVREHYRERERRVIKLIELADKYNPFDIIVIMDNNYQTIGIEFEFEDDCGDINLKRIMWEDEE